MDRFVDDRNKRLDLVILVVTGYWIWQCIWQIQFFWQLTRIVDQNALFHFMNQMEPYSASLIVRVIFWVCFHGGFPFAWPDFFCLLLTGALLPRLKKEAILSILLYASITVVFLIRGLSARTLETVVFSLRVLGGFSFLFSGLATIFLAWKFIKNFLDYLEKI
jgi:hypothetical protein